MENVRYRTEKTAIVLATYQGEDYVQEQLDSLLDQTNKNWVAYIHDDGSSDRTVEILKKYVELYPEKFVLVPHERCGGAKDNFLFLLSVVDAPYVLCCDQDDVWLPNKIETTLVEMKKLEKKAGTEVPCLVFTELCVVDEQKHVISNSLAQIQKLDYDRLRSCDIAVQNIVTGCTMMVNRKLLSMLRMNTDHESILWHDWWCALIAAEFGKISVIKEPTILYRQHAANTLGAKKANSIAFVKEKIKTAKEAVASAKKQAKAFCDIYAVESNSLLYRYVSSFTCSKFRRILFNLKNDIRKGDLLRNVGFIIYS